MKKVIFCWWFWGFQPAPPLLVVLPLTFVSVLTCMLNWLIVLNCCTKPNSIKKISQKYKTFLKNTERYFTKLNAFHSDFLILSWYKICLHFFTHLLMRGGDLFFLCFSKILYFVTWSLYWLFMIFGLRPAPLSKRQEIVQIAFLQFTPVFNKCLFLYVYHLRDDLKKQEDFGGHLLSEDDHSHWAPPYWNIRKKLLFWI